MGLEIRLVERPINEAQRSAPHFMFGAVGKD